MCIRDRDQTSKTYVALDVFLVVNITYRKEFNGPSMQYVTGIGRPSTPQFLVRPESVQQYTTVLTVPGGSVGGGTTPTIRMTEAYNPWVSHTGKLLMVEPIVQVRCKCKYDPVIAMMPFFSVCELPGGYHNINNSVANDGSKGDGGDGAPAVGAGGARLPRREESSTSSSTTSTI
eukprot:TRINITY_DN55555_c0_g1_i2.p1 TRINITY_DN55555_c0_g1~~TRINITY_DN55555_c0_g1_i2.p1  ORF type:complete len:175 (+),score=26.84 TRINITY_DN55555_c0_g1_i2:105-629(+)